MRDTKFSARTCLKFSLSDSVKKGATLLELLSVGIS
jgi:hypothetical protein